MGRSQIPRTRRAPLHLELRHIGRGRVSMSLWKIAWRSIQQRGLASVLTALSMALGVMLVIAVLSIHGVIRDSFQNNASLGYNMIVGAKGGKLQLTLNTVYYLSSPVENIDYGYFLEFLPSEQRDAAYQDSIQAHAHDALWRTMELQALTAGGELPGGCLFGQLAGREALERTDARYGDLSGLFSRSIVPLQRGRESRFGALTQMAIPLCLGDYYGNFRVVGTTPDLVDQLRIGAAADRQLEFSAGRNFKRYSEENGYFEAIVGAQVARAMDVKLGTKIASTHGDPEAGHEHEQTFTVVGILKPTGSPHDRAVFVNMEGFYLMEDHAKPTEDENALVGGFGPMVADAQEESPDRVASPDEASPDEASSDAVGDSGLPDRRPEPLPVEQREVTAILLRTSPLVALGMPDLINEGKEAQAVLPVREIVGLFELVVKPIQWVLLALTGMICVVSGIGILVSIYNSMSERRHEIAVMRALGAARGTVMTIILLESVMLSLGGGMLGWVMGHTVNAVASPVIEAQTGVRLGFWDLAPGPYVQELLGREVTLSWFWISTEAMVIPALLLLAIVVGFLPALSAYRTDVAKSLGS
jgi:putative ABC transport system permease protein